MKEFQEDKERKHEWDSDALDERPESVSDLFDKAFEALKEGEEPPPKKTPESVSDLFDKAFEALKEGEEPPPEKTPESVSDLFDKTFKALKEGEEPPPEKTPESVSDLFAERTEALKDENLTFDHFWEINSPPIENVLEKKSNAKEIRENLTEEGKRLELVVQAYLQRRREQAQQLNQLEKNIKSSAKEKVKELKVQEVTLSQEGQRLQDLVKTIREHRAQDKDGDFLAKLFSQGAGKITDSIVKVSEKANDSITQSAQIAANTLEKVLKPLEKPLQKPEKSPQNPETPPPPEQASQATENQNKLELPPEKKPEKCKIEENSSRIRHDWHDPSTVRLVEDWITSFAKQNGRSPYLKEVLKKFGGFFDYLKRENLTYNKFLEERGFKVEYNWRDPFTIKLVKNWIEYFIKQNGRTPLLEEVRQEFGGFGHYLKREKVSYNDFLKKGGHSPNIEFEYDWQDPNTLKLVENWISDFIKKNGRSPYLEELRNEFRGFRNHLKRKKLTYNEFLKTRGYFPNLGFEYNWQDPNTIKLMENWIASFVKEFGEPPSLREIEKKFGGVNYYFKKELLTYNIFLEVRGYSTHKMEQAIEEGVSFDKIGKDCMKILSNSEQFRVFHPITKEFNINYVHPDCIIHNFTKIPFAKTKNNIYLKDGQKFDEIIEIKRSLGSMSIKDWEIYTTIAKRLKIYLLKGSTNLIQEKNGCQIIFYSKNELFHQLRSKITPSNRMKVVNLIKKIQVLDKKLDLATIKDLDDY